MTENQHIVLASIPRSYAQVFFSNYSFLGWLLLGISFIDWVAGTCGLIAVIAANTIAWLLGYSSEMINQGMYGFNALLVGLGTGLGFQPGWELFSITIFAAVFTLFLTLALEGILYKYNLPYLSLPFMFGMWMVMLASRDFQSLGLSERGIYTANELFTLGGKPLVDLYYSISHIDWPPSIRTYLLSLGAIFFQTNLFAGMLIAIGLLLFSRIAFTLSVLGFSIAWGFYQLTGASIHELTYTYIGFNYILTAIAIGGIFLVPSFKSYLWTAILLPIVVMLTLSLGKVFFVLWSFGLFTALQYCSHHICICFKITAGARKRSCRGSLYRKILQSGIYITLSTPNNDSPIPIIFQYRFHSLVNGPFYKDILENTHTRMNGNMHGISSLPTTKTNNTVAMAIG